MALWISLVVAAVAWMAFTLRQEKKAPIWALALARVQWRRGRRAAARKTLERATQRETLFGERSRGHLRNELASLYMADGQYEAAVEQLRLALSVSQKPALEVWLHQRLADCLDALGDPNSAAEERLKAEQMTAHTPIDTAWYMNEARRLEQSHRYAELCGVYLAALRQLTRKQEVLRPKLLVNLAKACYEAGYTEAGARHAEEALDRCPSRALHPIAHNTAAVCYSALGELDRAELHRRRAYELALEAGNRRQAAIYLASLGMLQMKRGKLVEAMQASEQAIQMDLGARRLGRVVEGHVRRLRGQWEEARTAYERARKTPPLPRPSDEQRSQAGLLLIIAWLEADRGEVAEAARLLDGIPMASADRKLRLWHGATRAWVSALAGWEAEARAAITAVDEAQRESAHTEEELRTCHAMLARAYTHLGEYQAGEAYWRRYLAARAEPVYQPVALYGLALCCLEQGKPVEARAALQSSLDLGLQTHHTREARRLLSDLGLPASESPDA